MAITAYWERPRKPKSRLRKYIDRSLNLLIGIWVLLLFFPQPLFAHSISVGRFFVYSDQPIPKSIETVISKANARLATSPYNSDADSFSIYIATSTWRRCVMNPLGWKPFGTSNLITGNTILNRSDVSADLCFNNMPAHNQRSLHSVIAHECTHQLLRRRLGLLAAFRLPTWKNEGYCEYVAGDTSFDLHHGIEMLASGRDDSSPAFQYVKYYLAVRHILETEGFTEQQLVRQEFDLEATISKSVALSQERQRTMP